MPTSTTQPERQRCRHIHADGRRCGSPCLRGEAFCYFHHTSRKPISRPEARRSRRSAFDLPLPEDRTSIQLSIGEILRRIALNDVDPRRAGLLLYGLQIASTNLAQARHQANAAPLESPVEELTNDPTLGPLAPPAPFLTTTPGSKPSFLDVLLERLHSSPKSEASPEAVGSEANLPEAVIPKPHSPAQPQPAPASSVDPVTAASLIQPVILRGLQATVAPAPFLNWSSSFHLIFMPHCASPGDLTINSPASAYALHDAPRRPPPPQAAAS